MPPKLSVLPGMHFGQWSVIAYDGSSKYGNRMFRCACDCGSVRSVSARELHRGLSLSCGHASRFTGVENRTHGKCETKLYKVWSSMKARCSNSKDKAYPNYGGRGIFVCEEWLQFEPFYKWAMANGYKTGLTIERKNNGGNYEPSNCMWIPKGDQSNNTRRCRMIFYQGEKHTIKDWALILGVPYARLQSRLKYGWDIDKAIQEPLVPRSQSHKKTRKIANWNRVIEFKEQRKTMAQWADDLGIRYCTLEARLRRNWPVERALSKGDKLNAKY